MAQTVQSLRDMAAQSETENTRFVGHHDPTDPRKIAFYDVPGGRGVHRMWFRDLPYAHLSAQVRGAKQQGYQIVDLSDPYHPTMAGAWWVPGTFPEDPDPWEIIDHEKQHELAVHG